MINLTEREVTIAKLLIEGKTNKEIGKTLFISFHTVKATLEKIYRKTDCHSRVQFAIWAMQNGVLK